jgi:hypothetical protein
MPTATATAYRPGRARRPARDGRRGAGLGVLGPRDEVELITPSARELLASMRTDRPTPTMRWPRPCSRSRRFSAARPRPVEADRTSVTVPGSDGWITLHASQPGPPGDRRVAVVLKRAGGARSATTRLEAFGAACREQRWPRPSSCLHPLSRTTSRACTRSSTSPRGRSSSPAGPGRVPPPGGAPDAADVARALRPRIGGFYLLYVDEEGEPLRRRLRGSG